ncbi:haloacetate dehalogenase [Diaminobutyricimonas aerilata]|uniref:Haloacetate dehalogenase n=1 Tax=Diaminobutyricimonas aerilata TaxID=1162967 RepID=A0A2M9CP25_9MICO|nr:alpha/beta hydrolase [Diaminobutyricimonas aerilata]PJJ73618.1 haloacetate dehalogenase [Diaminobutyricimonas aerilata]
MFEGFEEDTFDLGDSRVFARWGGSGPPVVLLHGHPRTSSTWHRVAPLVVDAGFTVVCPDLRGYGRSSGPATTADHAPYSKRAMAGDILGLMDRLGHERFHLVGHDRGSYVALRLALDSPSRVERLVLMDCIPISEHLENLTPEFATEWFHWFFFAQSHVPERVITADPEAWYGADPNSMGAENHAEWLNAVRNPATVHAMLEDYRAGLTVDRADELRDRSSGRRVEPPLLVLQASEENLHADVAKVWGRWATDVRHAVIESGHHSAEEAPEPLSRAIVEFLRA